MGDREARTGETDDGTIPPDGRFRLRKPADGQDGSHLRSDEATAEDGSMAGGGDETRTDEAAAKARASRTGDRNGGEAGTKHAEEQPGDLRNGSLEAPPDAENADEAQQNDGDGVGEDMATLALNPGAMSGLDGGLAASQTASWEADLQAVAATGKAAETGDAEVMLRLKAGDLECFDYLMNKYRRPIVHFMYRMVHNQAVAEEMAQEVFLRVYRSRETYRAEARFTTWLYRIATNLAVNHARDTKNERAAPTVHLDEPDYETGTMPDVADSTPTAEADMLQRERRNAIKQHVMALPERQRMAVLMHKYQEMDYKQIGSVLKLSESATKSLLFRAYQTLRERLKEFV